MARVTWLGEDQSHSGRDHEGNFVMGVGPSSTTWFDTQFTKGIPVEVHDPVMLAKAKANKYFKVEGIPGRPRKVTNGDQNAE